VVVSYRFYQTAEPNPLFEFIFIFENNFESSLKNLSREFRPGSLGRVKWYHFCEGQRAASPRWAAKGNARHRLKHAAMRLPPAGHHTGILCRNRRRHNNCSNRQRRREGAANDIK
jgi:hypothetical protein